MKMHALVFLGPANMEYREVPTVGETEGEVLIEVEACGICGSDMHGWHGQDPRRVPPLVMGHEGSGWIRNGKRAGQRVTINPLLACMHCSQCLAGLPQLCPNKQSVGMPGRPGAFADFVSIPERNAVPIPDSMDFRTAALTEPVAVSYHAVRLGERLVPRPLSTMRVLVIGAGPIGLAAALVLRARNAKEILLAETHPVRRDVARTAGISEVFDPMATSISDGSVDLVIDAVGAKATRECASRVTRFGGAIVHLGLLPGHEGLDVRRITLGEITFSGCFCYTWSDFQDTIDLLARGDLGPLTWVQERRMREGHSAFEAVDRCDVAAAKIVLRNDVVSRGS
jgi:threonine dehydrogenase-like Zn-dependent dehydrogenase